MAMVYLALLLSFQLYEPVWPYASVREVVLLGSSVILGSIGIGLLLWWDIGGESQVKLRVSAGERVRECCKLDERALSDWEQIKLFFKHNSHTTYQYRIFSEMEWGFDLVKEN